MNKQQQKKSSQPAKRLASKVRSSSSQKSSSSRMIKQSQKVNPLQGKLRQMLIESRRDGSIRVHGAELIASVQHSTTDVPNEVLFQTFIGFQSDPAKAMNPSFFALDALPSIAGVTTTSRLAYLAQAFEKFSVQRLEMEVVSTASLQVSGGYFHSFLVDPLDVSIATPDSDQIVRALTREGVAMGSLFEDTISRAPVDPKLHCFVSDRELGGLGPTSESSQVRLAYPCVYRYAATGPASSGCTNFVIMNYDFVLECPTLPEQSVADSGSVQESALTLMYCPTETSPAAVAANEATTVIPSGGASGSLLLDPGASNTGTFKVITELGPDGAPRIVPWWNYTSNTFNEPMIAQVRTSLPISCQASGAGNTATAGPYNTQLNSSSTYSATRDARLIPTSYASEGTNGLARDGLGSGIFNAATEAAGSIGAICSGVYDFIVSSAGQRFDVYLNGSNSGTASTLNTVLPTATMITIGRLLSAFSLSSEERRKLFSTVRSVDSWSLPGWFDLFGGIKLENGCQAYATLIRGINSLTDPFDNLDADWREELKAAMIREVENNQVGPSLAIYNGLWEQLNLLRSSESEAVALPRPTKIASRFV